MLFLKTSKYRVRIPTRKLSETVADANLSVLASKVLNRPRLRLWIVRLILVLSLTRILNLARY